MSGYGSPARLGRRRFSTHRPEAAGVTLARAPAPAAGWPFGRGDDPFTLAKGRSQDVRFAVGRRAAEVRLVTAEDLAGVYQRATERSAAQPILDRHH